MIIQIYLRHSQNHQVYNVIRQSSKFDKKETAQAQSHRHHFVRQSQASEKREEKVNPITPSA
jgi:hypothetical protein